MNITHLTLAVGMEGANLMAYWTRWVCTVGRNLTQLIDKPLVHWAVAMRDTSQSLERNQ